MLRSLKELLGYQLLARDGQMGKVDDFFFNDEDWTIRYLVVDTGPWIFGQKVLIPPLVLMQPVWASRTFPVGLNREQVKSSPDVDTAKPVSREYEEQLYKHYNWTPYWSMSTGIPGRPVYYPPGLFSSDDKDESEEEQSHIRSTNEVLNYSVHAIEGEVGDAKDFIINDENWQLLYLVVDTAKWLKSGKQVLVALEWLRNIEVAKKEISLDLTRDSIELSPDFDPNVPVNRQYEEVLYDYHGRPKYWQVAESS